MSEYVLKGSDGRVVDKISLERVNQLKDLEGLKKTRFLRPSSRDVTRRTWERKTRKHEELEKRRQIEKESFNKKLS